MSFPSSPGGSQGIKTFKVSVPEATYQQLERQATGLGISVKQHAAPVLVALADGNIKPQYVQSVAVASPERVPTLTIAERLTRIRSLSGATRTVFAAICEGYELSGGQKQADTNRELAQALGLSWRAVSMAISRLEVAGLLAVKLFAGGGDGRHLWPTERGRATYSDK